MFGARDARMMRAMHRSAPIRGVVPDPVGPLRTVALRLLGDLTVGEQWSAVKELQGLLERQAPIGSAALSGDLIVGTAGVAITPDMAALCAQDFVRTVAFVQGSFAAIREARQRRPDRPVQVLYAGCGPWCTLALPLMACLDPDVARFELIDLQPRSLALALALIESFGLSDRVSHSEVADAVLYVPVDSPDVVLYELMRAVLDAEPHVAATLHFRDIAPDALLVPEAVTIDAELIDVRTLVGEEGELPIPLGCALRVDRTTTAGDGIVTGGTVRLPDSWARHREPMLVTRISVFGEVTVSEGASGLTIPRPIACYGDSVPGDVLQFSYVLGDDPRLRCETVPSEW
ncbi:MAG: hypothetical protein KDA28_13860 [Phycisphaerales bacterium]|nr:hypothetical protein [Phycisphaerales bacterium]